MGTIPIPQGTTIGDDVAQNQPQAQQTVPIPSDAVIQNEGEQINDVGNAVIVPKPDESFADTMARAAAHGKTVTPDQLNREVKTMPGKVATTLAAAPVIGAAGAAALAAPGEAFNVAKQALSRVIPTTVEHVKAIGAWAHENPIHAYVIYQILKELLPGVKKAAGIIHGLPNAD
jgi:hypothetical protein